MKKIICFGPGPQFKGGISNYNTSLALAFDKIQDVEVEILSWTQQYPAIIPREFVDKSSKSDLLEGTKIKVTYLTNYNSPATWKKTYNYIIDSKPDKVIFQWSIAIQGLPLGYLARKLSKHSEIEVIFDLHFVIQKENSNLDKRFTRMGIRKADSYIVHALKTYHELKELFPEKEFHLTEDGNRGTENKAAVLKLYHPIYDLFKEDPGFNKEKFKEENNLNENVFLFFGFIRKYKGLHQAISAFNEVVKVRKDVSLLICGESFWKTLDNTKLSTKIKNGLFSAAKSIFLKKQDDERNYDPLALIEKFGLEKYTMVVNEFIPNEDVHKYFQSSDNVVLFYLTATPSGVESLSYNFNMPILATDVGHFPETIQDGFNGYLAKDRNIESMSKVMLKAIDQPIDRNNVRKTTEKMSWKNYAEVILAG